MKMVNYNYLSFHPTFQNPQNEFKSNCSGFSSTFLAFTLNVLNFVLLFSGLIILIIVTLNEISFLDQKQNLQLPVIRSLLPKSHPLNLIYYQLLICGTLLCFISLFNILNNWLFFCKTKNNNLQDFQAEASDQTLKLTSPKESKRKVEIEKPDCYFPNQTLCFFIFFLLLLFTIQLCVSLFAFIFVYDSDSKDQSYENGLHHLIQNQFGKEKLVTLFPEKFDVLQETYKCCGFESYHDYSLMEPVPESCCITKVPDRHCGLRKHPNNIYFKGCLSKISKVIMRHTSLLGSVAFGFAFVEMFGLIFSCCLYVQQVSHKQ